MSDLQKELDDLRALHAEVSGRNVTLHTENLKLRALCEELIRTGNQMLVGHFNLYKSVFSERSNPDDDIVRLEFRDALAKAREMGFK